MRARLGYDMVTLTGRFTEGGTDGIVEVQSLSYQDAWWARVDKLIPVDDEAREVVAAAQAANRLAREERGF